MENSQGTVALTALKLPKTCFSSEQERLEFYARALQVPVQIGTTIKGDQGDKGDKGDKGNKGDKGDTGASPNADSTSYPIATSDESIEISGDITSAYCILVYESGSAPTDLLGIKCMWFDGTKTTVYFDGPAPDEFFKLKVVTF